VPPAHCRSSTNTTSGRSRDAAAPQHLCRRSLRAGPCGQRITRVGRHPQHGRELRHARGEQRRVRAHGREDLVPDLRQIGLRFGQQQPPQRPQRLVDRVEVEIPPVLVERAGHEPPAGVRDHRPQLVDQRGLPHPWRAGDQHARAAARQRLGERRVQLRRLGVPADQPRRGQQPQRDVVLADRQRPAGICRQLLQVVHDALGRLVAAVGLLLQQVHDDLRQRSRHGRVDLGGGRRIRARWSCVSCNGSPEPNGGPPVASS
jgi:hypothetical protein